MRKYVIFGTLIVLAFAGFVYFYLANQQNKNLLSPAGSDEATIKEKPLEKYTFANLRDREYKGSEIKLKKILYEENKFTSHLFTFNSDGDKVSGVANLPSPSLQKTNNINKFPVIILLRGYIDKENYQTGAGTKNASYAFARNGYITLAPDFLGYGESASPSADVFEERFQKYTTALNLLSSIKSLPQADSDKIALWGHSNGGHLALSILELTGNPYPTVLWAPVSKPFPYSILYYTDEYDDRGKLLRKKLSEFEEDYDVEEYNFTNYYDWINDDTPIQMHQGTDDDSVPLEWSNNLYQILNNYKLDTSYYTYPGEDHNFARGAWQTVINRNILFFKEALL